MWNFKEFENNIAAISDSGEIITYLELSKFEIKFRDAIDTRSLVFCLCTNTIGSLAGYTALINNKVVALLLDHNLDSSLLNYLEKMYTPNYLWVPAESREKFSKYEEVFTQFNYSLLKTKETEKILLFDELALLLPTSGSTGSPKLVRQSYNNILSNVESIIEYLEIGEAERAITTLPMNYTYGLSIINSHLMAGATILLTTKLILQKEFWDFFKKEKATSISGVPYTYEILKRLKFSKMDLSSLKIMTQAGGKLSSDLHKEFAEFAKETNKKFFVMYGQTEATARMSYLPYDKSLNKKGSIGIAIPGGRFKLIDANENIITKTDTVGELIYEGKNVTLGYAECIEDLSNGDENNGILFTGDIAKYDEDGYYYIVGRKKRFLKIFGNRVNLDEIETMLKAKFDNGEFACTGKDDKMYIYITDDAYLEDVKRFISKKTKLHSSAFLVKLITKIPMSDSGKILYSKLDELDG